MRTTARAANAKRRPATVSERARALLRDELASGPRPASQIEAAAIPERVLLAATDVLGVRTQKGQWWLPS